MSSGKFDTRFRLVKNSDGNVGIGTTTPQNALNVIWDINATGAIYKNGNIAVDYVFDSYFGDDISEYDVSYDGLMSLSELQEFVRANRHLPRLSEDKYTGEYEIGNMDELLLEKIEESHLYILELKAENDFLKLQNQEILDKLEVLENK